MSAKHPEKGIVGHHNLSKSILGRSRWPNSQQPHQKTGNDRYEPGFVGRRSRPSHSSL